FFISLIIITSLSLQLFPRAGHVAAQDLVPVKWVLLEVQVNPDNAPLQGEDVPDPPKPPPPPAIDVGKRAYATFWNAAVSEGSFSYHYRSERWRWRTSDGPVEKTPEYSITYNFTFDTPPTELLDGEEFQFHASGEFQGDGLQGDFEYPRQLVYSSMFTNPFKKHITISKNKTKATLSESFKATDMGMEENYIEVRGPGEACVVRWVYELRTEEEPSDKESGTSQPETTPQPDETPISQKPVEETAEPESSQELIENKPETLRERIERAIAQNLVDYIDMNRKFENDLQPLYSRADAIMEDLRDAQWFLAHGTDEDKEQAKKDIERLQDEMKKLMEEFNARAAVLEDVLDGIESQFVQYEQKQELMETLDGYWSQLSLMRINLALRSGNVDEFDELFHEYRDDENIADQVLVGNAFRRLMTGDTRTALESVKLALEEDSENPTARQLLQNLETYYLDIIRDKVVREKSQNAQLFNNKLNGHGQEGVGSFLLDVLTTGVGESFQALAAYMEIYESEGVAGLAKAGYQAVAEGKYPKGYYDFLQEISSLNIDEATAQVVGIQFVKDLRQHGVTLDEMSTMTVPRLQEIVRERFGGRILSEEQATVLRKRIWDAFKNPDVDILRKGGKMQLDIDIGGNYFDTEVLEAGTSDIIMRQFSAWDTFLTFAPSAQLGRVSKLGVAQRLGLKAETTLQQGIQKGFRIEELGKRLYQTRSGAAVIDGTYQWTGFTEMVSQAVKKRVGDVAYATGSAAVQAAMSQMSAPARTALKNEILEISDYYMGAGTTATVEATIDTMGAFFGFIGLNSQALQRGAYGVEDLEKARERIQSELTQRQALAKNAGIAEVSSRPIDFDDFEVQVMGQGNTYLQGLRDARDRVKGAAQGLSGRRGLITSQADEALEQMEEAAIALRQGNRAGAQQIFDSMQSGAGRKFNFANQENLRKLGGATDTMRIITALESKSPTDRAFAAEVAKKALSFTSAPGSETTGAKELQGLADVLAAAALQAVPE
ncbi:hypothetical protein ACFLV6_03350, partial [Chloroflexota bacterium]